MFIKSELTKDQQLKRKEKALVGKTTKDKFNHLLLECNKVLKTIKALNTGLSDKVQERLTKTIEFVTNTNLTTSDRHKLFELMVCHDDSMVLFEDIKHQKHVATHIKKLNNILDFISNFNHQSYEFQVEFYQESTSSLQTQLKSIVKAMQYKSAKMNYQINQLIESMKHAESLAMQKAQKLKDINKNSFEYQEVSQQIMDIHQKLEMEKGQTSLARKAKRSIDFLIHIFDQLIVLEDYTKSLKSNGPTLKLIKHLYKNPSDIEVMETILDLTETMTLIKTEINEVESLIKPAQKLILKDATEMVDSDLIAKYQAMAESGEK